LIRSRRDRAGRRGGAAGLVLVALLTGLPRAGLGRQPSSEPGADEGNAAADAGQRQRAREHYRRGDEQFRAGRFDEAYAEWEAGYALSGRPLFLVNMAHAQRRRGDLGRARELYQQYLRVEPGSKVRADVEAVLREIDQALASREEAAPPAASPAPEVVPPPGAAGAPPPVAGTSPGLPASGAGLSAALMPRPSPSEASPGPRRRWWLWAGAGGALALGVVTTLLVRGRTAEPSHRGSIGTLGAPE
jgi:tetratricopeptide (TPR) repeat protein